MMIFYKGYNTKAINIHKILPFSNIWRPKWDEEHLPLYGYKNIKINPRLNERVYLEGNKILYHSTPLFMVSADK